MSEVATASGIRRLLAAYLPVGSLRARLATGVFWVAVGTAVAQALGMVVGILRARILAPTAFGEFGMIFSTVGMFGVFAGFGLGLTATKHVAQYRRTDPEKAGRIIGLSSLVAIASGGCLSILVFLLGPWLAANVINGPHLATKLQLGAGMLFFDALAGAAGGALAGFEAFRTRAGIAALTGILGFPVVIAGVWYWGLGGAVVSSVVVSVMTWVLTTAALKRVCLRQGVPVSYRGLRSELPLLWSFSLPAVLAGVMVSPVMWAASTILVHQPRGYAELGVFNAASQWRLPIMLMPVLIGQVLLPVLSERLGSNDIARARRLLSWSMGGSALGLLPLAGLLSLLTPKIMGLYGAGYASGSLVLVVLVWALTISALLQPVGQLIAASGRMWVGLAFNAGWGIVLLGLSWLLVNNGWGAQGLAVAYLCSYGAHSVWVMWFAHRFLVNRHQQGPPSQVTGDFGSWGASNNPSVLTVSVPDDAIIRG